MRKHSVRKWLHAILDLLPVIILPIFAIYSHRHTIDSYEVTVPKNELVTFNQLYNVDNIELVSTVYGDVSSVNGLITCNFNDTDLSQNVDLLLVSVNVTANHYYYIDISFVVNENNSSVFFFRGGSSQPYFSTGVAPISESYNLHVYSPNGIGHNPLSMYVNVFDFTLMFGSGNEPTIEQFNTWYPNDYYEYNTGTKQLLKNVSTVTYDNTDIGSQMMYSLYKPINDYFNLNNVFNFGAIYDWFELNMFNGNAPLSIFIVWNIIVYEFIMDIIFLIYSVFMFVIDFACETLDRFTGWAKRGD